jgi:hypothetical protein
MLRVALPHHRRTRLHAEGRISLRALDAGSRRCGVRSALDINRARRRRRSARIAGSAKRCGIRLRAGILTFLRLSCHGEQNKRYRKQRASDSKVSKEPHNLPRLDSQLPSLDENAAGSKNTGLVDAGRALPIDNVNQLPWILIEVQLQLALFIDNQLRQWVEKPCTLALILIVKLQYAGGKIEGHRLAIRPGLTKPDLPIGGKDDPSAGRCRSHRNVGAVIAQSTCDFDVPYGSHLLQRSNQPLVLALLESLHKSCSIRWR